MNIDMQSSTEQHTSWLASNPVVGCPMDCAYCFLKPSRLTHVKPKVLFTVSRAIDDLLRSPFYTEKIPVATGTRTEYFSTPEITEYLRRFINEYAVRHVPNPLVIISKKKIPLDFVKMCVNLQEQGMSFLFFLSYSGLEPSIEKGSNPLLETICSSKLYRASLK